MGRKLIHDTPEKKAVARAVAKSKTTTITLDKESVEELRKYKEALAKQLGFKPSYGQTLRYLIAKANT